MVGLNVTTLCICGGCHHRAPMGLISWVHAATWPTYEFLQPLRVQIVQGGKLSHGTHDAHFPSAPSLPSNPLTTTTLSPPNRPHPPLGRRTISAPLQAEVEQQRCCSGGSMWSALQLRRTEYKIRERCVGAAGVLFNLYNKKYIAFLQHYPNRGQCVFSCVVWDCQYDGSWICFWCASSAPVSIHLHFKMWTCRNAKNAV